MVKQSEDNKRTQPRYRVTLEVTISGVNKNFKAQTQDLSKTGMFLKTTKKFIVDEFLDIVIEINPLGSQIEILGKVVHQVPGYGVGIRFIEYKDNAKKMVDTLIEYAQSFQSE